MSFRSNLTGNFFRAGASGLEDLRFSLRISVWVRWFLLIAWLLQFNYRPNFAHPAYIPTTLLAVLVLALNAYVHYRLRTNRAATWRWALLLSTTDVIVVTAGIVISSSGFQNTFFVLYYPVIAAFAVVFTSFRLSFAWVVFVASLYAAISLVLEPGVDFGIKEEKVLFTRIVAMFGVVAVVSLIARFEQVRRIEAVERERELQRERIEISQNIHDTVAQSAYMIGLGLEGAMLMAKDLKRDVRDELLAKLGAIHGMARSTMWELRRPIDAGSIFEGKEFSRILRSHASTFTVITSIATEVDVVGTEVELGQANKVLLFSIAHNALTNVYRHSGATDVRLSLVFEADSFGLSVADNGVGLPQDYEERGRGISGMRTAVETMGGKLETSVSESGKGTVVFCTVPLEDSPAGR